jgi:alcohol dehydrogenase (cytochrome c)
MLPEPVKITVQHHWPPFKQYGTSVMKQRIATLTGPWLVLLAAALALSSFANAQTDAPRQVSYTQQQATDGKQRYEQHCAVCHGYELQGFELAPSLKGRNFEARWGGKSVEPLVYGVRRMPPTAPGSLPDKDYADVLAFLFSQNGVNATDSPFTSDAQQWAKLTVPNQKLPPPMAFSERPPRFDTNGPVAGKVLLDKLTPVTEAQLRNPPAGDWLMWRRSYDTLAASPLNQINDKNVKQLQVAWSWSLPDGGNMMAPIVRDGVMFTYSFGDVVQALDARSGDLLWSYQHKIADASIYTAKKGVAIYADKILVPTSDAHLLALDARTGKLLWDHAIDVRGETSLWMKSAPIIAKGKAIIGSTGQLEVEGGNFIVAIDLSTGKEAWRFHAIARPGEPNGSSWNGLPLEKRTGGSMWNPGTYDPELNLVYFGPAPTYDTKALRKLVEAPGITNDALYTNTTIALNPDTGKLVWHYQHLRNDQLDHDWAFERQVVTLSINGAARKVVITGGKQAIFEALDAATGAYLFSIDLDMQNVITAIDPKTGAKTINPAAVPDLSDSRPVIQLNGICPNGLGARNLQATALNGNSKTLFIPLSDTCIDRTGKRWQKTPVPDSEGLFGIIRAVNLESKKTLWTHREVAPAASAALLVGDSLLFVGTVDRWFEALDQRTGKVLWRQRLNNAPSSFPITYQVDGKQYIAVATNRGSFHVGGMSTLAKANNPQTGSAMIVYALPSP